MIKKHSRLLAVLLALTLLCAVPFSASADGGSFTQAEIDQLLGVTTDSSQITSPFIEVVNQVRKAQVFTYLQTFLHRLERVDPSISVPSESVLP